MGVISIPRRAADDIKQLLLQILGMTVIHAKHTPITVTVFCCDPSVMMVGILKVRVKAVDIVQVIETSVLLLGVDNFTVRNSFKNSIALHSVYEDQGIRTDMSFKCLCDFVFRRCGSVYHCKQSRPLVPLNSATDTNLLL